MRRAVLTALAIVLLGTGCSDQTPGPDGSGVATPSTSSSSSGPASPPSAPPPTPSASPSSSPSPSDPSPVATGPAAAPRWVRVQREPIDGQHVIGHDSRYTVTRGSDPAGTTTITDRTTKKVAVRHAPPSGFVAQSPVILHGTFALVEEIRSEGASPMIRAYRYDLRTGARQDLAKVATLPPIREPEIGGYGDTFAYATTDKANRSCLIIARLSTLTGRSVGCVAAPGYYADPVVTGDSVTYSELVAPDTPKRCKRLLTMPLSGGTPTPVPAAKPCIQWSGATIGGATIWSEVAMADPDQYLSKGYLKAAGSSKVQPLGTVLTDTIVGCGSWIFWEVRKLSGGVESYEIHRWRTGATPQKVYTSPPDSSVSGLTCAGDQVLVESSHLGAGEKYADALVSTG